MTLGQEPKAKSLKFSLDILEQAPEFSVSAVLSVDALAPLSMVAKMPGKYYRSQRAPTHPMLFGMLENALGWHIGAERDDLIKQLQKQHGGVVEKSSVGFASLLQFHLRFTSPTVVPVLMHYDDLWSQHLKGNAFVGGSRAYDHQAAPLMDALAAKKVKVDEGKASRKDAEALTEFQENDAIHLNVLRPHFPQYYVSPTPREYVVPQEGQYLIKAESSPEIAHCIGEALKDPAAPLYLGSNEGWIEAEWRILP